MIWFNEVRNEVRPRVGEAGRARPHWEHRAQQHERIECDSGGYMERRATNVEGILGAAHLGRGTLEDAAQTASWKPSDEAEGRAPSKKRASIFATRLRPQKKVGLLKTSWCG